MTIKTTEDIWLDKARNREIPVKIYWPENPKPPVLIFSHGIGGSRESYKYIGEFIARHGIASIHLTHLGIDASLMTTGDRPFKNLKEAANDPENLHILPEDIHFMLDYMEFKDMPLDLSRVAMAGHSFGSYVTLAIAGQAVSRDGTEIDFADDRIKCAIAISPLATRDHPEEAYEFVEVPILHITGVKDDSPFGLLDPKERRVPFDNMNNSDQYLVIFEHADHMVFAAQRRQNKFSAEDVKIMELTASVMLEFLKKYLLEVNSTLDRPEFSAKLAGHAVLEKKLLK